MEKVFLRANDVAYVLGVSRATVWKWVKEGKLPQPIKIGRRIRVWRMADIKAAAEQMAAQGH